MAVLDLRARSKRKSGQSPPAPWGRAARRPAPAAGPGSSGKRSRYAASSAIGRCTWKAWCRSRGPRTPAPRRRRPSTGGASAPVWFPSSAIGPCARPPSTGVFDADSRSGLPARAALGLDRDDSPDPNGHLVREGGLEPAFPPDDLSDPEAELAAVEAAGATEEVPLDLDLGRRPQLAVEVRLEFPQRPLAVHHVTRPRSRITSHNRRSRALLPRCSRDITVPIGTSRISAISL